MLVTDVGLPGMNGRQLADVARQHRPDLPVLFMTGYAKQAASADFLGRIENHAATWRDTMARFRRDAEAHDGHHYAVRYESLLDDAAGEMQRLFRWFGCDASEA